MESESRPDRGKDLIGKKGREAMENGVRRFAERLKGKLESMEGEKRRIGAAYELAVRAEERSRYSDMKVTPRECEYETDAKTHKESLDILIEAICEYTDRRRS